MILRLLGRAIVEFPTFTDCQHHLPQTDCFRAGTPLHWNLKTIGTYTINSNLVFNLYLVSNLTSSDLYNAFKIVVFYSLVNCKMEFLIKQNSVTLNENTVCALSDFFHCTSDCGEEMYSYGFSWKKKGKPTLDSNIFCEITSRRQLIEFHKLIITITQHSDLQSQQEVIGTQSILHNCHQYGAFAFKVLQIDNTLSYLL